MDYKYLPKKKTNRRAPREGGYYISDDDYVRNRYYAYLKHKSFRQSRNEPYDLLWEHWDQLWTPELWERRGRGVDNVQMYKIDPLLPWSKSNIEIRSRKSRGCVVRYD